MLIRSGASNPGALPAVSRIGTTAIDTMTDASRNRVTLCSPPKPTSICPIPMPPIDTIM